MEALGRKAAEMKPRLVAEVAKLEQQWQAKREEVQQHLETAVEGQPAMMQEEEVQLQTALIEENQRLQEQIVAQQERFQEQIVAQQERYEELLKRYQAVEHIPATGMCRFSDERHRTHLAIRFTFRNLKGTPYSSLLGIMFATRVPFTFTTCPH